MSLDRRVYLSVGDRAEWVRAPDYGLVMDPTNWGESRQLVNGSSAVVGSVAYSRTFSLAWGHLRRNEYETIMSLLSTAGTKPIHYMDCFIAQGNAASLLTGLPHVLADTFSPVAYDHMGTPLARNANGSLEFLTASVNPDQAHEIVEDILVPPGYRATAVALGQQTNRVASFGGIALTPGNATSQVAANGALIPLRIRAIGNTARLDSVMVTLTRASDPAPSAITWSHPVGAGLMRMVPGSLMATGASAATGVYSMSVELVEVWPWQ